MLMAISLSQLCENAERSYSMRLIAGSGGVENTVRWVHIVEESEVHLAVDIELKGIGSPLECVSMEIILGAGSKLLVRFLGAYGVIIFLAMY